MARIIRVEDEGKLVYEGEDKRFYDRDYKKGLLGIPFGDWIKISLTIFGIITFMIKDNIRIGALEEGQKKLTEISQSVQSYMESSDGWNSSMYGTQFKGGRPIDGSFHRMMRNGGNL